MTVSEMDIAERIQFQANRGLWLNRIATVIDVDTKKVKKIAAKYGIRILSYRKARKGAWGCPNAPEVPALPETSLQYATTALQRQGYVVYPSYIVNGPRNTFKVDHEFLTKSQLMAKAEKFCGYKEAV